MRCHFRHKQSTKDVRKVFHIQAENTQLAQQKTSINSYMYSKKPEIAQESLRDMRKYFTGNMKTSENRPVARGVQGVQCTPIICQKGLF